MRFWRIPSWSGDYEILPHPDAPDTKTRVRVVEPTPSEIADLTKLFAHAKKEGWIGRKAKIPTSGTHEFDFEAPILAVGTHMALSIVPSRSRLTAIRSKDGSVDVVYNDADVNATPEEKAEVAKAEEKGIVEKIKDAASSAASSVAGAAKGAVDAVTTVKAPTRCCPLAVEGPDIRASEVLEAFLSPEQQRMWDLYAYFYAIGHRTGHRYRVCHRHSDMAISQGKVLWDMTDEHIVHVYDHSVPPAEEALALKLYIENREEVIRNDATLALMDTPAERNGVEFRMRRFKLEDPTHAGISAGTADAGFFQMLPLVMPFAGMLSSDPLQAGFRKSEDYWDKPW
jgi:hypothetical protein